MEIIKDTDLYKNEIEKFVLNHSNGNFFQSLQAYEFYESVENHKPFVFAVIDGDEVLGLLKGVVINNGKNIKKYMSRRAIIWGGPLINEKKGPKEKNEIVSLLLTHLNKYCKKETMYTEFRNIYDMSDFKEVFSDKGFKYKRYLNYIVSLENYVINYSKLKKDKRYELKKSKENGLSYKIAENISEVRKYYEILKELYSVKVKKPLNNFDFFRVFFETKELGIIILVMFKCKVVGGVVCPIFKNTIYELYEAAEDIKQKHIFPNVLATYSPIEYGLLNGLKYYDMMGAGKPEEKYGVRDFKSKFGGEMVEYGRFFKINKPLLYKTGELGLKFLSKFS
ncbi:MAG: peptidoglycan bridge formation glycyltransferase FemA/FemB family protein [Candidatus Kapaibacterium sp.]